MNIFDFAFNTTVTAGRNHFKLSVRCRSTAQRLAIVGPSGSGKSLTLQLLAGLMRSQHGHVLVNGICYADSQKKHWAAPQQRDVGLVFQDYALFPHLTVAQNIAFGLNLSWKNPSLRLDKHTAHWLERMQLESVANHYPQQISGGQKQRAALARACIAQPKWLLLDEPFSALDTDLRAQMRQLVADLQAELAVPMIMISHDVADTQFLADEVLTISQGVSHQNEII